MSNPGNPLKGGIQIQTIQRLIAGGTARLGVNRPRTPRPRRTPTKSYVPTSTKPCAPTSCRGAGHDSRQRSSNRCVLVDVGECLLGGPTEPTGFFQPAVSVTNSTEAKIDFIVVMALIDAEGIRRGTAVINIGRLWPQNSARRSATTLLPLAEGFSCEVRAVTRLRS